MGEGTEEREIKKNQSLFAESSGEFTIYQSKVYKNLARQPRLAKNTALSPVS
jgi:hypothetical protein